MIDESFEFASQLFYSRDRWLHAIAESWLTGNGENDPDEIKNWLNTIKPDQFATECLEGWFTGEFVSQAPTLEDLTSAFARLDADRTWLDEVCSRSAK